MTIDENWAGERVDTVLRRAARMSPSYISSLKFREGGLRRNGRPARGSERLEAGDVLQARIDDAGDANPFEPMAAALCFLYEDEYLAVLDKAAPMAVHGSHRGGECTVANALAYLWGSAAAFHPVNRLDRGTSGAMVIAKSAYIHDRLRRGLHSAEFQRTYLAIGEGRMEKTAGCVELPLGPSGDGTRRCVRPDGRPSRTEYRVLERRESATLLELRPATGRTHQIRVHLAALGHPLLGDTLYGAETLPGLGRVALHSWRVRLLHPITGVALELEAPLPAELARLWRERK